jgi:hypothetical protein
MVRILVEVVDDLVRDYPDDEALREKVVNQRRITESMAVMMFHNGARSLPDAPAPDERINPYAVGLDSSSWESDGLYDSPGLSLKEAGEVLASAPAPVPAS